MSTELDIKTIKSFLSIKGLLITIISIFIAGVISVVTVTTYLDARADSKYFHQAPGQVLETRVHSMEENIKEQSSKMDVLQQQQGQLLMGLGKIEGKLDTLQSRR